MCANTNITWQITKNFVESRMIDNSLIHAFVSSRKIQKRTKLLNAELRKYCGAKNYKEYIEFKTNILRHFEENPDTDDPGYLTDIDYSIIYSSDSIQAKYVAERTRKYNFTNVDYEAYNSKNNNKNTKHKKTNKSKNSKNTEIQNKPRRQKNKSSGTKHNTFNKHINIGWQEVVRQRDVSHLSDETSTNISNNERNIFKDKKCNSLKSQSNNRFSQRLASKSSTLSNTEKSINKKTRKNNRGSKVTVNKLHSDSEDNTITSVTEVISENKVQNEHQDVVQNDSNSELDSQSSHYNASPSDSTTKINYSNSELNSFTQNSEDSIEFGEIEVFNKNKEQICEHQDAALNESNVELELQSSHDATPFKSIEKLNDFNNEVNSVTSNFEDGIISSKIEVFNESKEQIFKHQVAALNELNAELDTRSSHCKVTPSKSTEKINDFNNEVNSVASNFEDGMISSKIEVFDESKVQIYGHQNTALNESNAELDTRSSHCKTILSKSRENVHDANLIKLEEDNSDKLTQANNKNIINTDNYNSHTSYKSKLLKNVRRNLTSVLEEVDFTNNEKNINTDKNRKNDGLNHDQLHLSTVNSSRCSTPSKERQINELRNSSPDIVSLDQQKDSGFDDDSQDKFVKIKKSDIKSPMSRNIPEKITSSPEHPERITNEPDTTDLKDFKEDVSDTQLENYDNYLREQNNEEITEYEKKEIKNSSPNKNVESSTINQEYKTHFVNKEDLSDTKKQLLSPEQECLKDTYPKSDNIIEKQSNKDKEMKKSFDEKEVMNSIELNRVYQDTKISTKEDKMHLVECTSESDIQKPSLLSPKKECTKNEQSRPYINILDERDNKEVEESSEKEVKDFFQSSQNDKGITISPINTDETHTKLKDECDTKKLQLPKITCTEIIINTKYKIINKKLNDINSDIEEVDNINATSEHTPADNNASINCSNIDWQDKTTDVKEIDNVSMMEETDNEEENACYMSPQTQKRLQQQAKLNLVNSDSSESDSEAKYIAETSRKPIDNSDSHSDASCSSKNDIFNDETDYAREKINTDTSSDESICVRSKKTSISAENILVNATNMKKGIKKKPDEAVPSTKCIYENSSRKSVANKSPLKETQYSEKINDNSDEQNEHVEDIERSSLISRPNSPENILSEFSLRISESNVSCNNDDSNGFSKDFRSSLNKKTVCNKSQSEHSICTDNLETSCKPGFDISYERPYNLQQLIEDQKLLVETLPASFTLADISDDDEAFILNIPNKVLQYNLKDELLTIKGDTIKFGKNKCEYKIVRKKVGTTSCVFATGKKRKPYKIVNINEISTVTVRERLPPYAEKSDILASHSNVISTKSKSSKINNQQTAKRDSKILEVSGHKRKRCISDFEIKQSAVKKRRSKNHF